MAATEPPTLPLPGAVAAEAISINADLHIQKRRAGEAETGCSDRQRFELELEFLHCLANPGYLNWLAQNRYFEDGEFLSYLQYLQYWRQPQYAKFVVYPHALYFLELLLTPEFRAKIANPAYKELVHTQQFFYWQHARANRVAEKAAALQAAAAAAATGAAQAGAGREGAAAAALAPATATAAAGQHPQAAAMDVDAATQPQQQQQQRQPG